MKIIDAIKILAASKDIQLDYLSEIGTYPSTDELILQFSDTYFVLKREMAEGVKSISVNLLKNINSINVIFDEMSNIPNNPFWEASSLDSIEWTEVRKLARDTLKLMDDIE